MATVTTVVYVQAKWSDWCPSAVAESAGVPAAAVESLYDLAALLYTQLSTSLVRFDGTLVHHCKTKVELEILHLS